MTVEIPNVETEIPNKPYAEMNREELDLVVKGLLAGSIELAKLIQTLIDTNISKIEKDVIKAVATLLIATLEERLEGLK